MQTPSPTNEEVFFQTISELSEYKDYFTDKEKNKELALWVCDELNVTHYAARFLLQKVIPIITSKLVDTGEIVAKSWLSKIHERLGEYSCYLGFCKTLLDILKTKTDKTFELAITSPTSENLNEVIKNDARWEQLSSEKQSSIKLLLGQNTILDNQELLNSEIERVRLVLGQLLDSLIHDLALTPPDQIFRKPNKLHGGTAEWLNYSSRSSKLTGRKSSLIQLESFFNLEDKFAWWAITGAGGTGKSRLALEAITTQEPLWEVGFFNNKKLEHLDSLTSWYPSSPTIIIIDYGAEYPSEISSWLDYLILREESLNFPVRILILERDSEEQGWWKDLTSGSTAALKRQDYLHTLRPLHLSPLTKTEQKQTLLSYLETLDSEVPSCEFDDAFWGAVSTLSDNGKPLYIGMIAAAINNIGVEGIRKWEQKELLDHVYQRERLAWERLLDNKNYSSSQKQKIYDFLAFCTLTSGLDWKRKEKRIIKALIKSQIISAENEIYQLIECIETLTGKIGTVQPDILGEYYVLQHWAANNQRPINILQKRLCSAQKVSPEHTQAFVRQCAIDYPLNESTRVWWESLYKCSKPGKNRDRLYTLTYQIITRLLGTQYSASLSHWVSVLHKSENPTHKDVLLQINDQQSTTNLNRTNQIENDNSLSNNRDKSSKQLVDLNHKNDGDLHE